MKHFIIGDIHGNITALKTLLQSNGYNHDGTSYKHPDNIKTVFLGDLIDKRQNNFSTVEIVKNMVEHNGDICIMGNHELNAIAFHETDDTGTPYRKHSQNNILQHHHFLDEMKQNPQNGAEYITWFKTLPLFYETNDFIAIHACPHKSWMTWLQQSDLLDSQNVMKDFHTFIRKGSGGFNCCEILLKGLEHTLPEGVTFKDYAGIERNEARIEWWKTDAYSLQDVCRIPKRSDLNALASTPIPSEVFDETKHMKQIYFGHYQLEKNEKHITANAVCLDWSKFREIGYALAEYNS